MLLTLLNVASSVTSRVNIEAVLDKLVSWGIETGKNIIGAILIYVIGRFLIKQIGKLLTKFLERRKLEVSVKTFLKSLLSITLNLILAFAVIARLGVETTSFAAILASAGVAIGMALGVFLACKNAKFRGVKSDDIIILACYVLPLSVLGAKLYYLTFSGQPFSFWDIFKIWEAGLAIYGGVIGGALGLVIYCLIHKKNILDMCDIAAPSLILGQAIGRIGCYFAGCCYGIEVTNPSLTWFPLSTFVHGAWHLSTFFYESLWDLLGFVILMLVL